MISSVVIILIISHIAGATDVTYGYEDPSLNLVVNWDHSDDPNGVDTTAFRAAVEMTEEVYHTGNSSYFVTNRTSTGGGVIHKIYIDGASPPVKKKTNYYVSMFVMLEAASETSVYSKVSLKYKLRKGDDTKEGYAMANMPFQHHYQEWLQIGGIFKTPNTAMKYIELILDVSPSDVNYYVDTVSVIELPNYGNDWRSNFTDKIDTVRKGQVTLNLDIHNGFIPGTTQVQITHERHDFKFGIALKAFQFVKYGGWQETYRNWILDNFNWAGFENDFKWRVMQEEKDIIKFAALDESLDILLAHNISVRAAHYLWNRRQSVPDWVQDMTGDELRDALDERMDYMMTRYGHRLFEVDVTNEQVHDDYIETALGDPNALDTFMSKANEYNRHIRLVVNDYELLRSGAKTSAVVNLMTRYKKMGYNVGIGMQGHLREYTLPMQAEIFERRLQMACITGIPVSITEFSVHSSRGKLRANEFEQALMIIFSQPCVESILISGFSDLPELSFTEDSTLFKGAHFRPNGAGAKLMLYMNEIWRTNKSFHPVEATSTEQFMAFHGRYKIVVKNGDTVLREQTFYVSKGEDAEINLTC